MNENSNSDGSSPWAQDPDAPVHEHRAQQELPKSIAEQMKAALEEEFGVGNVTMMVDGADLEDAPGPSEESKRLVDQDSRRVCRFFRDNGNDKTISLYTFSESVRMLVHEIEGEQVAPFLLDHELAHSIIEEYREKTGNECRMIKVTFEAVE